jgi:uncharacterized membrane protein YfcA
LETDVAKIPLYSKGGNIILRYIVALVLIAHGFGHAMSFSAAWTSVKMGVSDAPWILPGDSTMDSAVGHAFGLLWLVATIATVAAALGLLFRQDWWAAAAASAAVISLVAAVPWWCGSVLGALIGSQLAQYVPSSLLRTFLGIILLMSAIRLSGLKMERLLSALARLR